MKPYLDFLAYCLTAVFGAAVAWSLWNLVRYQGVVLAEPLRPVMYLEAIGVTALALFGLFGAAVLMVRAWPGGKR